MTSMPRWVRASAASTACLLLTAGLGTAAEATPAPGARWVVTATGPDGPVFTSVTATSGAGAQRQVRGATTAERDLRVSATDLPKPRQWALNRLQFDKAWSVTQGDGVVVGVIDSGVDAAHPDLAGRVLKGATFLGAGYTSHQGQTDVAGHGTHVAGIVAASPHSPTGVSGGAPAARILPVRVLDDEGSGWGSDVARGIVWAVDHGAQVLNLSFGSTTPSRAVQAAVAHARARGVLVVAAGGNDGRDGPISYPATYPGVLSVGAVDPGDAVVPFSTTNPYIGIAAPGESVLSTVPVKVDPSRLAERSGTSMAAPYVAAAAALVLAARPTLTGAEVAARLQETAQDLGPLGRDDMYGAGLLDPARALGVFAPALPPRLGSPSGLQFSEQADGSTVLSWTPVPDAHSYAVLLEGLPLNLESEEGGDPVYVLRGSSARFPAFPRGLPVPLQVVAVDALGLWSPPSAVHKALVDVPLVPAPQRLTGHSPGSRTMRLAWTPVRMRGLAGYWILRNGEQYDLVEPDVTTYVDSVATRETEAPVDGRRYSYRVVAMTDDGISDPTAAVDLRSFTPWRTSPPDVVARTVGQAAVVRWAGPVPGQTGWRVYVDGRLKHVLKLSTRSIGITHRGGHTVTVVRLRKASDQGPGRTVRVTVPG
ncbi:MAG: peptidase [Frankiales bacterium]|nr:peptidase [Frankiales bacterium]